MRYRILPVMIECECGPVMDRVYPLPEYWRLREVSWGRDLVNLGRKLKCDTEFTVVHHAAVSHPWPWPRSCSNCQICILETASFYFCYIAWTFKMRHDRPKSLSPSPLLVLHSAPRSRCLQSSCRLEDNASRLTVSLVSVCGSSLPSCPW